MAHTYRLLFTLLLLTPIILQGAKERPWFLSRGYAFPATFIAYQKGEVALKNSTGKVAKVSVKELGLVDRYYLHEEHDVPLEELEGKNDYNPEYLYTPKGTEFERGEKIKLKGKGYNFQLNTLLTPHFVLIHDRETEVAELAVVLERIWYSHAYRSPGFLDLFGEKRKLYFYIGKGETFEEMAYYFAEQQGELSDLQRNTIMQNWSGVAFDHPYPLPAGFAEKYNCEDEGMLQINNSGEPYAEAHLLSSPLYKWQELYLPGANLPQHRNTSTEKRKVSAQGFLAIVLANEIRLNGNENKAFIGLAENSLSLKYPPQGKPAKWGKELNLAIEEEVFKPSLDVIYDEEALDRSEGSKERNLKKTYLFMAIGRFLQKDLKHMISSCRLSDYLAEHGDFPPKEELSDLYGYGSTVELDEALALFIKEENKKH